MASASHHGHLPPSFDEQNLYYHGFRSCPKLVARSSQSPWTVKKVYNGTWEHWANKSPRPVGAHPIADLWNSSGSDSGSDSGSGSGPGSETTLRSQITNVADELGWSTIDILRIGYLRCNSVPQLTEDEIKGSVILLLGVEPNTTSWDKAISVALRCKRILEDKGIHDVECEVSEGEFVQLATQAANSDAPPLVRLGRDTYKEDVQWSEGLGAAISVLSGTGCSGTKGL